MDPILNLWSPNVRVFQTHLGQVTLRGWPTASARTLQKLGYPEMGVPQNRSLMCNGQSHLEMDDFLGYRPIYGNHHISTRHGVSTKTLNLYEAFTGEIRYPTGEFNFCLERNEKKRCRSRIFGAYPGAKHCGLYVYLQDMYICI